MSTIHQQYLRIYWYIVSMPDNYYACDVANNVIPHRAYGEADHDELAYS